MLRLSTPHLNDAAIAAAAAVLRTGALVHGEQGRAFERELADWLAARHAVLVSSGTAALHLALITAGIRPGDAVLVPDFTFPATGSAVVLAGARPVLVEVDASSYCITQATLADAIACWRGAERLRAVMPVHEFGYPVDMRAVGALAEQHGLVVIEDAACAIGARTGDRFAGTIGDIGCFSLHPRKTITCGEGGILTTADESTAQRLRRLRNHGLEAGPSGMQVIEAGYNYRLTDFQAALGRAQLPALHEWIAMRRALAAAYRAALEPLASAGRIALPADHPGHSWQTFMVVLADGIDRDAVKTRLAQAGIESNLGAYCLSRQPAFTSFARGGRSVAGRLFAQGLALPFCEQYGAAEVEQVAAALAVAVESAHD
jgi:dTDP-4-amino-4,6-dideoxygalactose transaminase